MQQRHSIANVIDLPPRIVRGTIYTQEAVYYREGYKREHGVYPTDSHMARDLLNPGEGSGETPDSVVERLWTKDSVSKSKELLLGYWVAMFLALTYCTSVFLLYLQTQPAEPPVPRLPS